MNYMLINNSDKKPNNTNYSKPPKRNKLILAALILIILIPLYGYISWNAFKKPTFLSVGVDCMPTICPYDQKTGKNTCIKKEIKTWEKLFGKYCATY